MAAMLGISLHTLTQWRFIEPRIPFVMVKYKLPDVYQMKDFQEIVQNNNKDV